MSYIISNITTNGSYLTTNSSLNSYSIGTGALSGYYASNRIPSVTHYTLSDEIAIYNGQTKAVFISKTGKPFIFVMSKNGLEYKKYLK